MKFEIVELLDFSGYKTGIYTDELHSVFDTFIQENRTHYSSEIDDILSKFETIGLEQENIFLN